MLKLDPWSVFVAAWIAVLVTALALGAWGAREALLLAFTSVVLAVVLLAVAWPFEHYLHLARRWSLTISGVLVLGGIIGLGFVIGAQLQSQVRALERSIPQAVKTLERGLIAMVLIGALAGVGTWLIGLESPLALGLFAGLAEFVPIVGPIIGAVPALLVAGASSLEMLTWTALLFIGIQQLESNIITPIAQQQMTDVPPFLLLFALVAFGFVFGTVGLLVAAPLTVVVFVLVEKLYVEHSLESGPAPSRGVDADASNARR